MAIVGIGASKRGLVQVADNVKSALAIEA